LLAGPKIVVVSGHDELLQDLLQMKAPCDTMALSRLALRGVRRRRKPRPVEECVYRRAVRLEHLLRRERHLGVEPLIREVAADIIVLNHVPTAGLEVRRQHEGTFPSAQRLPAALVTSVNVVENGGVDRQPSVMLRRRFLQ
jgi:hypothetical protein